MRTYHIIICPECKHEFPFSNSQATHAHTPTHTSPSSLRSEGDTGAPMQMRARTCKKPDKEKTFIVTFPTAFRANTQFRQVWRDFAKARKDLNKRLTQLAVTRIVNKLKDLPIKDVIAMIDQSIERSYTGVFPIKDQYNAPTSSTPKHSAEDRARFYDGGGHAAI